MKILQAGLFAKQVKKLHKNEKIALDDAIKTIIANPNIGESKKGEEIFKMSEFTSIKSNLNNTC